MKPCEAAASTRAVFEAWASPMPPCVGVRCVDGAIADGNDAFWPVSAM